LFWLHVSGLDASFICGEDRETEDFKSIAIGAMSSFEGLCGTNGLIKYARHHHSIDRRGYLKKLCETNCDDRVPRAGHGWGNIVRLGWQGEAYNSLRYRRPKTGTGLKPKHQCTKNKPAILSEFVRSLWIFVFRFDGSLEEGHKSNSLQPSLDLVQFAIAANLHPRKRALARSGPRLLSVNKLANYPLFWLREQIYLLDQQLTLPNRKGDELLRPYCIF